MAPVTGASSRVVLVATTLLEPPAVARLRERLPGWEVVHLPVECYAPVESGRVFAVYDDVPDEWRRQFARATVLVGLPQQFPRLEAIAPHLRLVQYVATGLDPVDLDALARARIGFVNASGVGSDTIAEFAIMALLAMAREVPERLAAQSAGRWVRFATRSLAGRTLLVAGAGPIGTRVCALAAAFGMTVIVLRRRPELGVPPGGDRAIGRADLLDTLPLVDAVMLAAPLSEETFHLVGERELAALPAGALLVNVGRGRLVDEEAVRRSLLDGHLGQAWLDVFSEEPLPPGHPLWTTPRLVVSAHDALARVGQGERLAEFAATTIDAWQHGRPLRNVVVEPRRFDGADVQASVDQSIGSYHEGGTR